MERVGANVIDGTTAIDSAHKRRTIVEMKISNVFAKAKKKLEKCKRLKFSRGIKKSEG